MREQTLTTSAWRTRRRLIPARSTRIASLCLAMALASGQALADQRSVANLESRASLEGVDLVLNGAGLRNFLFLDVYVMALYLPKRLSDANAVLKHDLPRRVRISLLRDVSAERDVEFLMAGLEANNTPDELAAIHVQLEQFLRLMRAQGTIAKGSVLQLDYLPNVGTRVWLNQRLLDTVPGAAFNRSVLKIWLGDQPTQENLKRALLGDTREAI
jgi:hypothetical protein